MGENNGNQKSMIEKGADAAKKAAKNKAKKTAYNVIKPAIPYIAGALGLFFLALLAVGVILLIQKVTYDFITSIFNPQDTNNSTVQTEVLDEDNFIKIDDDGAYKIQVKNLAKMILEELDRQKVNNQLIGFEEYKEFAEDFENGEENTEEDSEDTVEEIADMLERYMEAEIFTTYPKTEQSGNDIDGIIKIKRASSYTSETNKDLTYIKYKEFCDKVSSGNRDVLNNFSLNPENFYLCIAREGNYTQYYDFDDKLVKTVSEDGERAIEIEEIDYQKYIQNYSMPLNFLISLHLISQDKQFMGEFVDMVLAKNDGTEESAIELTYIDNSSTVTTTYNYSGKILNEDEEKEEGKGPIEVEFGEESGSGEEEESEELKEPIMINNDNIKEYYDNVAEYHKKIDKRNSGKLYVTKTNTWLKASTKRITKRAIDGKEDVQTKQVKKGILETKLIHTDSVRFTKTDGNNKIDVDEFIDLIKKYPNVEDNLVSAPSTLLYLLQQNEKTQRMERIMRYVFYELTDQDYGVLPRDFKYLFTDGDGYVPIADVLREYIRYWEYAILPETNEDGTCYIIEECEDGSTVVGYGVKVKNSEYEQLFIENGWPIEAGGEVKKEEVDAIENMILDELEAEVKAYVEGLELTNYQKNALIARAYSCGGVFEALEIERGTELMNFKDSCLAYWNQERDDRFEEQNNDADFTHELYKQYMSEPITEDAQSRYTELRKRRESEWTLFQTGYYEGIDRWHTAGNEIIAVADLIHKYMEENEYTYCALTTKENNGCEECQDYGKTHGLNNTFQESKTGYQQTCCSTYVSWVLQDAGIFTKEEHTNGPSQIASILSKKGWIEIEDPDEYMAGDIFFYNSDKGGIGHVDIYAGDGTKYNAGSGWSIRGASPEPTDIYATNLACVLRAPD